MPWNDDSWKDSYDSWKLASPDDEYDEPCDHEDYDIDIVSGRGECHRCGESWYVSEDEVLAAVDDQARYAEYEDRENRRQWWRDLWGKVKSIVPHRKQVLVIDDDIPF